MQTQKYSCYNNLFSVKFYQVKGIDRLGDYSFGNFNDFQNFWKNQSQADKG